MAKSTRGPIGRPNAAQGKPTVSRPNPSPGAKIAPPLATKPASAFRDTGLPAGKPAPKLDKKTDAGSY